MTETINVNDIEVLENTRTELGDLSELMASIKQIGLLEPILVTKAGSKYRLQAGNRRFQALKKLGRTELEVGNEVKILEGTDGDEHNLIINIIENIQREDITPIEKGKLYNRLKEEFGLSISEVAARLSKPQSHVAEMIKLYHKVPQKFRKHISFLAGREAKRGRISPTVFQAIVHSRVSKGAIGEMLTLARKEDMSVMQVRTIRDLMYDGYSVDEAFKKLDKFQIITIEVVANKSKMAELMKEHKTTAKGIITDILKGKMEKQKRLFI